MFSFLIFLFTFLVKAEHPIHVSVSDVTISATEIEWSVRIFKDDLLLAVYGDAFDMSVLENDEKVRKDILAYLNKSVRIFADDKAVAWSFKDLAADPEAIWITITGPVSNADIQKIRIRNRILLDVYGDQKNIVNLTSFKLKKNFVFEKGGDEKVITF